MTVQASGVTAILFPSMPATVIDTLLEIPSHVRVRLASALESGLLAPPWTAMAIRATVGGGYVEPILHVLQEWECLGVSPVADDYYQRGMQINRSFARDAEAARLGLRASVAFPAPDIVTIRLVGSDSQAGALGDDSLNLRFTRAAGTGADITIEHCGGCGGTLRVIACIEPPLKCRSLRELAHSSRPSSPISPRATPSASTAPAHRRSMRLSPNPRPPHLRPCPDCARGCTTAPLRLASRTLRSPPPA